MSGSSGRRPHPPKLAELLVGWLVRGPKLREGLLGDLHEEYLAIAESSSRLAATRWYWHATFVLWARYWWERQRRWCFPPRQATHVRTNRRRGRQWSLIDAGLQDTRYALRALRREPGFTIAVVLTLAIGIGANTAIFSVAERVLLRPLPYADPGRIVTLWQERHFGDGPAIYTHVAPANFLDWRERNSVFDDMAAAVEVGVNLTDIEEPERIRARRVSASFFPILGVEPARGRTFVADDDRPPGGPVVVLSHRFWQRRFSSDPGVVGHTVSLNGERYTVIGIMPSTFRDLVPTMYRTEGPVELWLPYPFESNPPTSRGAFRLSVVARLKADVSVARAQEDMDAITHGLREANVDYAFDAHVSLLRQELAEQVRGLLFVLLGAAGFVLLIACANVANLLMARTSVREKEIAIRAALGASRRRLLAAPVIESLVLALAGGVGGLLLARFGVGALVAIAPTDFPRLDEVVVDGRVLGFALIISLVTALAVGLAPAVRGSRPNLTQSLKEGARTATTGARHRRGRDLLVVAEIAVTLVLLVGAGLMINTFRRLYSVDLGFDSKNLLMTQVYLPRSQYAEAAGFSADEFTEGYKLWAVRPKHTFFVQDVLQRMNALAGVESAAAINYPPVAGSGWGQGFTIEGQPPPTQDKPPPGAYVKAITPGYLRTMGIPVLNGRTFSERDGAEAREVVIVNEVVAREYWADGNPMGAHLRMRDGREDDERLFEVVGVVGDVIQSGLDTDPEPIIYIPYFQQATVYTDLQVGFRMRMYFVARTRGDPLSLSPAMRRAVWDADADAAIKRILTMDRLVAESLSGRRFFSVLLGIFAGVALFLASVGIYGVMSYAVSQRTHEIGVRMALGASHYSVLGQVITRGFVLAAVGVVIGLAASLGLTRFMSSQLYGVGASDPATLAVVSTLLVGVVLAACYIPARRATEVDPLVALRAE